MALTCPGGTKRDYLVTENFEQMILKWIFDRVVALIGLLFLWPVLLIVAILVKVKMPGGPFMVHGSRFMVQG